MNGEKWVSIWNRRKITWAWQLKTVKKRQIKTGCEVSRQKTKEHTLKNTKQDRLAQLQDKVTTGKLHSQ